MWLVYAGAWSFVGALSWTTAAVYLIRDVGMSPPAVLLAMALWGLGWTFRSGAEDAWLADEVERLAGLVGIGAAVGLAMVARWLPFVVAGCVSCLLALILAVAMPEHGFAKPEKDAGATATIRAGLKTVTTGRRVVRAHPILLLILAIAFVTGAWSEGWDRLWEAHLLVDVGLPRLFGLDDVAWFGVLTAGGLVLSFGVAAPLVSRLERLPAVALPKLLLSLNALLIVAALAFALSGQLWPSIACYWVTSVLRSITDSSVRATVFSITNLAGSAGGWAGGPTLGWVGTRWSVRTALAVGAIALSPVLALFGRAVASQRRDSPPIIAAPTAPSTER